MVVWRRGSRTVPMPPPIPGVLRVTSINILGVTLATVPLLAIILTPLFQSAVKICMRSRSYMPMDLAAPPYIWSALCRSWLDNRISYAAPSWSGFASAEDLSRLRAVLARVRRWGLDGGPPLPSLSDILERADARLFRAVLSNPLHVLHWLLPPESDCSWASS